MSRSQNKGLLRKLRPQAESNSKKFKIKRSRTEAKTGFRIEDSKFVKSREIIGFINFSELLNKLRLVSNPYKK